MRFEHQPKEVRAIGRKGMAKMGARGRAKRRREWAEARGESVSSSRRSSRGRKRRYGSFTEAQNAVYGPVPFEEQPRRVRRRGRKSKARGSWWSNRSWGKSSRRGRKSRSSSRSMSRGSRRSSRSSSMSRKGSSRPMSLAGVRSYLKKHRSAKAWICVGPARTGCGGGRKGGRGSRVLGFLR
jgi:hypothetical protein